MSLKPGRLRIIALSVGCVALGASLLLLLASFFRSAAPADYVQRTRETVVWVRWGISTSLASLVLCPFGYGALRAATILMGVVVLSFWLFIAASLR